jgi:hypothetical protein
VDLGFSMVVIVIPSGKRLQFANWEITMLLMGKSTISMAMFNSKLLVSRGEPSHYLLVIRWRCDPESRIRLHLKIGLLTNKTGSIRESFVIYYIGKYIYIHNHIL